MRTLAWQDRQLHTACASWSQLRHDTILYAKQSVTALVEDAPPPARKAVTGYVEPSVEFYSRLLALNRMTIAGLNELNVLDDAANQRLAELDKILQQLIDISVKELGNRELNKDEYEFIKTFGGQLSGTLGDVTKRARDTRIIADVHTDTNSSQCVQEATGPIDLMLVVYRLPDGTLGMGVGPTLSYYEFKQPMAERLTDEAWQAMLTRDRDKSAGKRPNWTGSFLTPPNAK
jgi:hypothetical protein